MEQELMNNLKAEFAMVENAAKAFSEKQFFTKPNSDNWSAAEIIEHLFLSVKSLPGLFGAPQIMLEKWGRGNRPLLSYDELVSKYLSNGKLKSPPAATPQQIEATQAEQIAKFHTINEKFIEGADKLSDEILDTYQIPHPIIGLISVREMIYFTLYHYKHHLKAINKLLV